MVADKEIRTESERYELGEVLKGLEAGSEKVLKILGVVLVFALVAGALAIPFAL